MKSTRLISTAIAPLVYVTTCAFGFHLYGQYEENRMRELSKAIIRELGDPEITIRFVANAIILEGKADERRRSRAYEISRAQLEAFRLGHPWHKPKVINFIELIQPKRKGVL
jgi:hypothetical protein